MSNPQLLSNETILTNQKSTYEKKILFAILVLALGIRLIGFNFGLPYAYNPDEHSFYEPAYKMLASGDLNPHWFGHPGSTLMYALALVGGFVLGIMFLYGLITGNVSSLEDFIQSVGKNPDLTPGLFILIGRLMAISMAVLGVYILYLITLRIFNKKAALISSLCFALAPLHIEHSRIVRTDVPGTTLVLVSIFLLIKFIDEPKKTKLLIFASLAAGLAIATKYTLGLIVIPLLITAIYYDIKSGIKSFILNFITLQNLTSKTCCFIFIGFFIGAPFVILDFKTAFGNLRHEMRGTHLGAESTPGLGNYIWYLNNALRCGIGGIFIEIIAAWGLWTLIRKRSLKTLIVLIFPVLFFLIIGMGQLRWHRWFIPVLPFEALFFSIGLLSIYKTTTNLPVKRSLQIAGFVLIAILPAINLFQSANNDIKRAIKLCKEDKRTAGKKWIEANLPLNSKIAYERYTPHLHVKPRKDFIFKNFGFRKIISNDLTYYLTEKYDYIIIADSFRKIYFRQKDKFPLEISRYKMIEETASVVKRFDDKNMPGRSFTIYQLPENQAIYEVPKD